MADDLKRSADSQAQETIMRFNLGARSTLRCMLAAVLPLLTTGCAAKDFVWGLFGSAYSDGGSTEYDRNYHYEQRLEEMNRNAASDGW